MVRVDHNMRKVEDATFSPVYNFFFVKESGDHWNVELMSRSPISFCQLMSVFMSESYYYYCSSVVHLENRDDDNL